MCTAEGALWLARPGFLLLTPTTDDDPAARGIDGRTRIPHVGAPHILARAKTCVEKCVHNHPRCRGTTPNANVPAFLPIWLINCSDSDCLRIVETNSSTPPEPYVAISYVWGGDQPHCTTKYNLARYMVTLDDTPRCHSRHTSARSLLLVDGQPMHHPGFARGHPSRIGADTGRVPLRLRPLAPRSRCDAALRLHPRARRVVSR
ncbi:hypothetical protein GY45DRAFT_879521 [Cubamyces sp. BRFM 1775]|nr:hypothetical protein GY45DRAFT_879521 [Cubamyces sp. BRFM 1775]